MIKRSENEAKYTSTITKLLHNLNLLENIKDRQMFIPQSIQLAPTDKCNLHCNFCSVKKRNMDEIKLEDAKECIYKFKKLGGKTIEFTGGGDPTLYEGINELIGYAFFLGYKVGLITNGIALQNIYTVFVDKLSWLRVSLNGMDEGKYFDYTIPPNLFLGFSYVWNKTSTNEIIETLENYKTRYNARYVRVVPDCREVKFIEHYRKTIRPKIEALGMGSNFFFQEKDYTPPKRCWMGYLKPFVNSDGYVYHCSANPLINLKFNPKFRMGHMSEVTTIWNNITAFPTDNCGECFLDEQNQLIEQLLMQVEHAEFL